MDLMLKQDRVGLVIVSVGPFSFSLSFLSLPSGEDSDRVKCANDSNDTCSCCCPPSATVFMVRSIEG